MSFRYIDLTDEVKCKIEGSQKVAKKLERLNRKQEDTEDGSAGGSPANECNSDNENESDGDSDDDEATLHGRSHSEQDAEELFPSISSTQSQDIYNGNNGSLLSPCSDSLLSNRSCCSCSCHTLADGTRDVRTSEAFAQTLSTGDIVITKVVFEENE